MLGYVLGGVIRGLMVGIVALVVTILFTNVNAHSIIASIAVMCLAALVSALGGFITALLANSFDHVITIQTLILTPLMYVGGVFNPVSMLPSWAQNLSFANPMFYTVNALRHCFLGTSDVSFGTALLVMGSCGLALLVAAMVLMANGVGIRD